MSVGKAHALAGVGVDHENREKDDFYPTPPEGTRALLGVEKFSGAVWEPACGDGAISKEFEAAGYTMVSTDLVDRGYGTPRIDFLMETRLAAPNIVTNPPFKLGVPFLRKSLDLGAEKICFLMRLNWLEGAERRAIFESSPLARVWVFSRRLTSWRLGEEGKTGGMFAFAWFVWDRQHSGPPTLGWI